MPRQEGVVELYDGQIPNMRKRGHTLASIGERTGVSRERIRQILEKYYPNTQSVKMTELRLAQYLDVDVNILTMLREKGLLNPIKTPGKYKRRFYVNAEIRKAYDLVAKLNFCKHCGLEKIPRGNRFYCVECAKKKIRYGYPFLSDEQKKKWLERVVAWQKRNPDKVAITTRKANAKYWKKKQVEMLENTTYLITKNGHKLPKGTVAKAVAYDGGKIVFSGGIAISKFHVKKVIKGD